MKGKKKTNIIIGVMLAVSLVALIIIYPSLPDMIPGHWGPDGKIDRMIEKKWIFAMWMILPGINLLMGFAEKIDPKGENYLKFAKIFNGFRLGMTVFFLMIIAVTVVSAFDGDLINMNNFMMPVMGLMFMLLGNYMPKVKYNYTFGIKTPHTLASEKVWNKTHRMAGPIWMGGGLIIAVCGFFKGDIVMWAMLIVICLLAFVPMVYAYLEFKKEFPGLK